MLEPAETTFPKLLAHHLRLQDRCYVSGIDLAPDGGRLIWSERIVDFGLNFAIDTTDGVWVREMAARRGRAPVVLASSTTTARDICKNLDGAPVAAVAWMSREVSAQDRTTHDAAITTSEGPVPQDAFFHVMGALSESTAINEATIEVYRPTLRNAATSPDICVQHLTLILDGSPAACASVYAAGPIAGLYNVGVVAALQRSGLGRRITERAIETSARLGCSQILLQCVPGGHVEHLYASLGFQRVARPLLIALR